MTLPLALGDANSYINYNARLGPYFVNGSYYVILRELTSGSYYAKMYKATDPTLAWTAQDTANNPLESVSLTFAVDSAVTGNRYIHLVSASADTGGTIFYRCYDTNTDTWVITETAVTGDSAAAAPQTIEMAVRSDGSIGIVIARGTTTGNNDISYRIRSIGGVWSGATSLASNTTSAAYTYAAVVLGASDRLHFLWANDGSHGLAHQSLSSGGSLDSIQTVTNGGSPSMPIAVVDGDGTHICVPTILSSSVPGKVIRFDSGANPTLILETVSAGNPAFFAWPGNVNRAVHLLWLRQSDGFVVYNVSRKPGTWTTDAAVKSVSTQRMSGGVYLRNGNYVFGYVYGSAAGSVSYDEYAIPVPLASRVTMQAVQRLAVR